MTLLSELVPVVRTIDDSVDDTEALGFLLERNDTIRMGATGSRHHINRGSGSPRSEVAC
jgi:hypothetical protein